MSVRHKVCSSLRTWVHQPAKRLFYRMHQVSAEVAPLSLALSHTPKVVEKSDAARARIQAVIKHSFLLGGHRLNNLRNIKSPE